MTTAYYAKYSPGHHGARDRIGGLPTYLPPQYPTCHECNEPLTFIMQLYVDDKDLFDDSWLALQLYECDRDSCYDQLLIAIDKSARLNTANEGVPLSQIDWQQSSMGVPYSRVEWGGYVHWQDITWEKRDDPEPTDDLDQFLDDGELKTQYAHLGDDKLGGCFVWCDDGGTTAKELGAIGQFSALSATAYLFNQPGRGLFFEYF